MIVLDDPTAALGGLRASELFWQMLENNHLLPGEDYSTNSMVDPMGVGSVEYEHSHSDSTMTEDQMESAFEYFKQQSIKRFEYSLWQDYENGYVNNCLLDEEVDISISSEYVIGEYKGM